MITRAMTAIALATALGVSGCGHRATSSGADEPKRCPTRDIDIPAAWCTDISPHHGTTPATALQWGPATADGILWEGRLLCPDGTHPQVSAGHVPTGDEHAHLMVWKLSCPDDGPKRTWYVDPTRCGNPCPPPPFRLIAAAAYKRFVASRIAVYGGASQRAVELAKEALKMAPGSEKLRWWLGVTLFEARRYADALVAFGRAAQLNPNDPHLKLHMAMCKLALGRDGEYVADLQAIMASTPAGQQVVADVACRLAMILLSKGRAAEAEKMAQVACDAGQAACCVVMPDWENSP